jgi:hypothetical protein
MIVERTKMLNQERRKVTANVQSITDKMNRLTNRKSSLQRPYMVNEYNNNNNNSNSHADKGEKVVTFNSNSNYNNNHSTSKNQSSEGKQSLFIAILNHT